MAISGFVAAAVLLVAIGSFSSATFALNDVAGSASAPPKATAPTSRPTSRPVQYRAVHWEIEARPDALSRATGAPVLTLTLGFSETGFLLDLLTGAACLSGPFDSGRTSWETIPGGYRFSAASSLRFESDVSNPDSVAPKLIVSGAVNDDQIAGEFSFQLPGEPLSIDELRKKTRQIYLNVNNAAIVFVGDDAMINPMFAANFAEAKRAHLLLAAQGRKLRYTFEAKTMRRLPAPAAPIRIDTAK